MSTIKICSFCNTEPSKYKCPKCGSNYCSLKCFKDPQHTHPVLETGKKEEVEVEEPVTLTTEPENKESQPVDAVKEVVEAKETNNELLNKLLKDPKFLHYLKEPVIRYHILIITEILNEVSISQEYNKDSRIEIASKKLSNLRSGGIEQNEIFNEFIELILNYF